MVEAWHTGLTSTLPKGWQEGRYRSGPLSMPAPEAQMGIIWPESPRILTTKPRRNYKMASLKKNLWSNPTIPTAAQFSLATLQLEACAVQWRIGTGKEPEGD